MRGDAAVLRPEATRSVLEDSAIGRSLGIYAWRFANSCVAASPQLNSRTRPSSSLLPMKYLIQHPEPIGIERDLFDAGDVVPVARAVEAAGWDGLAFTEHPAPGYRWLAEGGGHQTLDPFVALGAAAAVTERIMLLTYLAVVPYRNPLILAKAAATVDIVSNGRFVLGVGTGYLKGEFY